MAEVTSRIEVITQQTITGGYIDMVLRYQNDFVAAIEVKVKSPENCQHHREQLENYKNWLDGESKTNNHLFTLVRNPDIGFCPENFGVRARLTWRDLFNSLKAMQEKGDLSGVESSLIRNFCNYLESEGIVSTYETKDLLAYEAGLKARRAVTGLFNQVAGQLQKDGFSTVLVEDRKDYWPQLKIQHARWKKIFGNGENSKISLWFSVPGIWDADQHAFCPGVELWHEEHGNDWRYTRAKLPKWLETLSFRGFIWDVYPTWGSKGRRNYPANEISSQPKRIAASKTGDEIILSLEQPKREDELINLLVKVVKEYAAVVDLLEA